MYSVADIEAAYRDGRRLTRSFTKNCNVATVAGTAHDLSVQSGNPPAQFYIGASGAATVLARSTDGGLDHGPPAPGTKKYLHKLLLQTVTAGAVPSLLEVLDYLLFYPFIVMDPGQVDLVNAAALPRYLASEGVQMMLVEQNPYVGGAQVQITYTNQDGVAGRQTPVLTLNSVTNPGTIATSAPTLAGARGLFIPLQMGDRGVQSVQSINFLTGDVGVLCIVLVKPAVTVSLHEITAPHEIDFWNQLGYLPEIRDDAYLNLVLRPAGSASGASFYGQMTTLWR